MPKKSNTLKGKESNKKTESSLCKKGPVYNGATNEIIMLIHAKPCAKENGITDVGEENVGVQIAAPNMDGAANKELIKYLSDILNLRKTELNLAKGSRSREKTVIISGSSMTVDDVLTKLKENSTQ